MSSVNLLSVKQAITSIKADYIEIREENLNSTVISFKGRDNKIIATPKSSGFFVRVLNNGNWGVASFTDIKFLEEKLKLCLDFTNSQNKGDIEIVKLPKSIEKIIPEIKDDFINVPLKKKVELVEHYNNLLFAGGKEIVSTNIYYVDSYLTKFFINSFKSEIVQVRPYIRLSFQAVAKSQDTLEIYRGSKGHIGGFNIIESLDQEMKEVSNQAITLAKSPKVKSGNYTVILDPLMSGTFAHEAFGHLSEADHQYENPKLLEQMALGKKLGSSIVNISDDPSIPGGWGNFVYDDEGVKAVKVKLLEQGAISGRLHSLETAKKLNEKPNGRARADGFCSRPIVRMSNTFFEKGKDKLNDLISSTKEGILVVNWLGGMTAMENFTFTAMFGVMIKKGKLENKVRGVKLMGSVFETLKNITGVSDDFLLDEGTCGKMGQAMPVGSGGAYVKIDNVTVGGD